MAFQEGKKGRRWDARRTARPSTISVFTVRQYDTPEQARAGWERDRCGLAQRINHWDRIMRIRDLVLIIKQRDARAKNGFADILTVDMRAEAREG